MCPGRADVGFDRHSSLEALVPPEGDRRPGRRADRCSRSAATFATFASWCIFHIVRHLCLPGGLFGYVQVVLMLGLTSILL